MMSRDKSHLSIVRPDKFTRPTEGMTRLSTALAGWKQPDTPPPDELRWSCPTCGVIEPRSLPTGRWVKRSCQCQIQARLDEEKAMQQAKWVQEQRIRTFGGWLGEHWIDEEVVGEMCSKTFESWDQSCFPEAYAKAKKFAQNPQGNLVLAGNYGTGKTHLEAAICNYLREVGRTMSDGIKKPTSSLFVSAPEFFAVYTDANVRMDKTHAIRLIESAVNTPLLVIDDVDKSRPTDFRNETYFLIFDERYKAHRPTIISTNREENLGEYLGEAVVYSRMMRGLNKIRMFGDDYRMFEDA